MNMKIDLKSALCGLAVGVLAMLVIGATISTPPGRFQYAGAPPVFLLVDTTTGQVWTANFAGTVKSTDDNFIQPKP
jgi:hypothetical protein